jgi:hypothetical protein
VTLVRISNINIPLEEEFEDVKGVIRIRITVYRRRTDNIMAKRKGAKGQTTIYT